MFDEEAPTISLQPSDVYEIVQISPIKVGFDTSPVEALGYEDTAVQLIEQLHPPVTGEKQTTDRMAVMPDMTDRGARASTNGDWPPRPREPAERSSRRAGMYNAITSVSKLTKLKPD